MLVTNLLGRKFKSNIGSGKVIYTIVAVYMSSGVVCVIGEAVTGDVNHFAVGQFVLVPAEKAEAEDLKGVI